MGDIRVVDGGDGPDSGPDETGDGPAETEHLRIAEAVGRSVIEAECERWVLWLIDDRRHIPRVVGLARAVAEGAVEAGLSPEEEAILMDRLLRLARDLFVEQCIETMDEDEEPEQVRREALEFFQEVSSV